MEILTQVFEFVIAILETVNAAEVPGQVFDFVLELVGTIMG